MMLRVLSLYTAFAFPYILRTCVKKPDLLDLLLNLLRQAQTQTHEITAVSYLF